MEALLCDSHDRESVNVGNILSIILNFGLHGQPSSTVYGLCPATLNVFRALLVIRTHSVVSFCLLTTPAQSLGTTTLSVLLKNERISN